MATGAHDDDAAAATKGESPTRGSGTDEDEVLRRDDGSIFAARHSDLAGLENIDEQTLLRVIKSRFHCGETQTYVGESLLVVNPYKNIDVYGYEWHSRYVNLASRYSAAPHVYRITDAAYRSMRSTGRAQCIVVSGESGAGKTETTKHVIEHVAFICAENVRDLHQRIVKVNPLLEAFGNASTVRNCNSSRFGKVVEMKFNERWQLVAANVCEYMLEKCRVVHQSSGESNFHIFFCLFAGMSADTLKNYYLEDPKSHRILDSAKEIWKNAKNKKHYETMFHEIEAIFELLNFNDDMKSLVYLSLAAVLFVTNIEFASKMENKSDQSVIVSHEPVNTVADLLCVKADRLAEDLIWNTTIIRGEVLKVNKSIEQARDDCDSLAKDLYSRLFSWIVCRVNSNLEGSDYEPCPQQQTISVLDLSGFENFVCNSFEQLCINIANEHIQQFFREHLIKKEKEVYTEEGFDWQEIDWTYDEELLQLCLQKPIGLFQLLDEESRFPEGTDKSLLTKWQKNCSSSSHLQFFTNSSSRPMLRCAISREYQLYNETTGESITHPVTIRETGLNFTVKHYAGQVEYNARGFLEKNRDRLSINLKRIMESSNLDFIKDLFSTELCPVGRIVKTSLIRTNARNKSAQVRFIKSQRTHNSDSTRSRSSTASQHFRNSLDDLVNKLKRASPHFIWCVKPNGQKQADEFDDDLVLRQLRYNGIAQVASVRRDGFPVRQSFGDFVSQYQCICGGFRQQLKLDVASCQIILQKAGVENVNYAIGRTKVFLKELAVDVLSVHRQRFAAVVLQCATRGRVARNRLAKMKADLRKDLFKNILTNIINDSQEQRNSSHAFDRHQRGTVSNRQQQHDAISTADQPVPETTSVSIQHQRNHISTPEGQQHNTISTSDQPVPETTNVSIQHQRNHILTPEGQQHNTISTSDQPVPETTSVSIQHQRNHILTPEGQQHNTISTSDQPVPETTSVSIQHQRNHISTPEGQQHDTISTSHQGVHNTTYVPPQDQCNNITEFLEPQPSAFSACDRELGNTATASDPKQPHSAISASAFNLETTSQVPEKETWPFNIQQNIYEEHGLVNVCNDVTTCDNEVASMYKPDDSGSEMESDIDDDKPPWDVAQNIPRERISSTESFAGLVRGLKVFTYLFIFAVVLATATVGTGCFLLLIASLRHGGENYTAAKSQLLAVMIIPYILVFIISFGKAVFGRVPLPSLSMICGVILVEVMHNFGVVMLVLRVLPCFGGLYGLGIMHSICLIPSILAVVFVRRKNHISRKQTILANFTWLLDVIALLLSVAAVAMPIIVSMYYVVNVQWASQIASTALHNTNMSAIDTAYSSISVPPIFRSDLTQPPRKIRDVNKSQLSGVGTMTPVPAGEPPTSVFGSNLDTNPNLVWQMPVALILVSFKWWENFVGDDRGFIKLFQMKRRLHIVRVKVNIITSVFGVGTIIASTCFLEYLSQRSTDSFLGYINLDATTHVNTTSNSSRFVADSISSSVLTWTPGILCAACGLICYYMSCLACKLLMQRVSFCLPLSLAPPTLATCIVLQCYGIIKSIPISTTMSFDFLCDVTMDNYGYYVTGAAVWYLVFLWICRHIWFPKAERIAKTEKLFVTPLFNGILFAQSIMINRRRNDNELKRSGKGSLVMHEDSSVAAGFDGNSTGDATLQSCHADYLESTGRTLKTSRRSRPVPVIYACATMWHETCNEMIQLLKSIFRMDADQCTRRIAQRVFKVKDPDYYEFEAHVFFDDCMDFDDDDKWVCNMFVKQLVQVIDEAASSVLNGERKMLPPTKIPTPYGGRLVWRLPGGNNLIVHLKDKLKIRHKKRWSQVMYMYYLLGFRLFGEGAEYVKEYLSSQGKGASSETSFKNRKVPTWLERAKLKQNKREHFGKSSIFETMEESLVQTAENTFLLALDGDVDFKPDAVRLLVDRMIKNEKTGASCGRIHPIGSGPLVWYQTFEYAVGHWFQKATEHVLGCVLCSPGCFSLFRGSALMDDNVMKKYATKSTEARHFLQYDQGEDRWLCTLLLQQGYRVDYSAAADALTYCPDNFDEFFNQRRRWGPSTIANIWDLLADFKNTVLINDNISQVYMLYQFLLMVSTILGPSTIVITIASAFQEVLNMQNILWVAYMLAIVPPAFYLVICFITKPPTQLVMAKILCTGYAVVMTVVLVGLVVNMSGGDILNPSLFFLAFVSASFVLAGLIHPYEFYCLLHGILYFICIPAGYLVLMIYSMSNMHIVSWGTREVPKRKSKKQQSADAGNEAAPKKDRSFYSFFRGATENMLLEIKNTLIQIFHRPEQDSVNKAILEELKRIRVQLKRSACGTKSAGDDDDMDSGSELDKKNPQTLTNTESSQSKITLDNTETPRKSVEEPEEELHLFDGEPSNAPWILDPDLGDGTVDYLDVDEVQFWQTLIQKYLRPIKKDKKIEEKLQHDLIELRNNASFGFWMVNIIWVILNFMLQMHVAPITIFVRSNGVPVKCEPLGFVFIVFFLVVLSLQVIGMLKHRWGTFLEVMLITKLNSPFTRRKRLQVMREKEHISVQEALRLTDKTLRLMKTEEPEPDYVDDESEELQDDVVPDDRGVSESDYEMVSVDVHLVGSRLESSRHLRPGESSVLDELDPQKVRQTISKHLVESRKMSRRGVKDVFPPADVNGNDERGEGSSQALPVAEARFADQVKDFKYSVKSLKKNTWQREYLRRLQTDGRPRSTVRFRHLSSANSAAHLSLRENPLRGNLSNGLSQNSANTRNLSYDGMRRDPRIVRVNELERMFTERLNNMSNRP